MKKNVIYLILGLLLLTAQHSFAVVEGDPYVCLGMHGWYSASSGITGGTWSTSNPTVLEIDASTGVATAYSMGSATVSYTSTGGVETMTMTVTQMPPAITGGDTSLVPGATTTLMDLYTGGKWSSGNPVVATVDSNTGVVTAHTYGHATIFYSPGGCGRTWPINVTFPAEVSALAQARQISVYPNPANRTLNIDWSAAAGTGVVTVSDITGHKVYDTEVDMSAAHGSRMLDLTSLPNGLYIMNVSSATVTYNSKLEIRK